MAALLIIMLRLTKRAISIAPCLLCVITQLWNPVGRVSGLFHKHFQYFCISPQANNPAAFTEKKKNNHCASLFVALKEEKHIHGTESQRERDGLLDLSVRSRPQRLQSSSESCSTLTSRRGVVVCPVKARVFIFDRAA